MDNGREKLSDIQEELFTLASTQQIRELSRLSLPQIDEVVKRVGRVFPAGNIPAVIKNGLFRLPDTQLSPESAKRDIASLFNTVEKYTIYSAAFAAPAAIIWGYQNLLRLAGRDPAGAFPQGTWQFYVNYALREDTARHTNETHGFDTILAKHKIRLNPVNRATALVMSAIHCIHQYDDLLKNEWRERVYTHILASVTASRPDAHIYHRLYYDWQRQRPYGRGKDARPHDNYPAYRRMKFNRFLERAMQDLPSSIRREWVEQVREARETDLPAYQKQLSILSHLVPDKFEETRKAIPLEWAQIGLVYQGCYYLLPICASDTREPVSANIIRAQITRIITDPASPSQSLAPLTRIQRTTFAELASEFSPAIQEDWNVLRLAPIIINLDRRPAGACLSEIRQGERGLGNHAMTIFDTGQTIVFDQSHIFFDGTWGVALSEIMTNEALAWATYLATQPPTQPAPTLPTTLTFPFNETDQEHIDEAPKVMPEVSAESNELNIRAIITLRRLFKMRNDLIHLTVNDILILYRAIHATTYQADSDLIQAVEDLLSHPKTQKAAEQTLHAIRKDRVTNPSVLIPVDASRQTPNARVHPITFNVPLNDLTLVKLHNETIQALDAYKSGIGKRQSAYQAFDDKQRQYLTTLAACGQVFQQAKKIAATGKSDAVGTIKLLAHLPPSLQYLLDSIPERFEILNDLIKGREVFSNVGAVAPTSTLTRFMTAKDDNKQKTLAWGILTDAQHTCWITLRDFRPHVSLLVAAGQEQLARDLTQDYLNAYAHGLNTFIKQLRRITLASRETRTLGDLLLEVEA